MALVQRGTGVVPVEIQTDAVDIYGYARVDVSTSTTAAQSAALEEGIYDIWAGVDTYIKVHTTANDVTTSNGYLLRANNTMPIYVRGNHKIGGILASGTGTLSYHRVG